MKGKFRKLIVLITAISISFITSADAFAKNGRK